MQSCNKATLLSLAGYRNENPILLFPCVGMRNVHVGERVQLIGDLTEIGCHTASVIGVTQGSDAQKCDLNTTNVIVRLSGT
jgi:hypothetical protein